MAHPCAAALPWGAELQCGPHEAPCDPPPHAPCRARPNRAQCRRPHPARRCAGTPLPPRNNTQQGSSSEDACALPRGERQSGARLGLSSPPRRPARPKHWHCVALLRHTWRWAERGAHRRQFLRNGVHASHTSCDRATRTSSRRTKPRRRLSEASPGSCSDTTAEPRCGSDGAVTSTWARCAPAVLGGDSCATNALAIMRWAREGRARGVQRCERAPQARAGAPTCPNGLRLRQHLPTHSNECSSIGARPRTLLRVRHRARRTVGAMNEQGGGRKAAMTLQLSRRSIRGPAAGAWQRPPELPKQRRISNPERVTHRGQGVV